MRGFVETPDRVADRMVEALLDSAGLNGSEKLLDPACGTGSLLTAVHRWADQTGQRPPSMTGIELDPQRATTAEDHGLPDTTIINADFLTWEGEKFDLILGNPPYVPITKMTDKEKSQYRRRFVTARGRFDLYILFFERALELLKPTGRLVFITPEKFLYVQAARQLRSLLAARGVHSIELLAERSFGGLATYPTITVIGAGHPGTTRISPRDSRCHGVRLPADGRSWSPAVWGDGKRAPNSDLTLQDLAIRISCGVATGADAIFVVPRSEVGKALGQYAVPTVSGRELEDWDPSSPSSSVMLMPYDWQGELREEDGRLALFKYLTKPARKERLLGRTCAARKAWYAFHETPPRQVREPKVLWRDVTDRPRFVVDSDGQYTPRHTVYYLVPKPGIDLVTLAEYLNGPEVSEWLQAHCQRASNGYLRLQSHVLAELPVPRHLFQPRAGERLGNGRSAVPGG